MTAPQPSRTAARPLLWFAVRIALTAAVFAYLFTKVDAAVIGRSLARIPVPILLAALLTMLLTVASGVIRWRLLFRAYGAERRPRFRDLWRWYLVAMFYNLLPGAVGGDVLRGYSTRHYFADGAAMRSVSVVFVERVLGFAGLLLLAAAATLVSPLADRQVLTYSALGLCAAAGAVVALALGKRLSPVLPARVAKFAAQMPGIEAPGAFAIAVLMSVVSHILLSWTGHLIIASLAPHVTLGESMAVFPIGTLAAYFPLTVAGAGARDVALVVLLARLSVAREDALATSLTLLILQLLIAGFGGLLQTRAPAQARTHELLDRREAPDALP